MMEKGMKICLKTGASIFELQTILGHTSIKVVKIYDTFFDNDGRESHKKFSSLIILK